MNYKRVTIICGHYGTGKTNIAVNMAFDLHKQVPRTAIADLDIVNPYFRTKDSEADLNKAGIRLICSEYANSNLDIPALPPDLYSINDEKDQSVILDIGGDDRGAFVLGRLAPGILAEGSYDMFLVMNCFRPLTLDAASTLEVLQEIQAACGIPFTGLINNSNLCASTSLEDILSSGQYAHETSELCGIPVVMTTMERSLYDALQSRPDLLRQIAQKPEDFGELFPLDLQEKYYA